MVTNAESGREAGRPRRFQDAEVFEATNRVLARQGLHKLTLDAIAKEVGCTPQALIRRFGSRRRLLLGHLIWVTDESSASFARLRGRFSSPLEALRIGYIHPEGPDSREQASPASYANLVVFGVEAGQDPELREELIRRERLYHQNLADGVRLAMEAGELAGCDPDNVAFLLLSAGSGALLRWAANPVDLPVDQITRVFDAIVRPFQTHMAGSHSPDGRQPGRSG